MENLIIPLNNIDHVSLIGGRQRKKAKDVWNSLNPKPDYLINAGMYDTKTGISVCDTVINGEVINGGNYTNRGYSWNTNDFYATTTNKLKRFFLGGGPDLIWGGKIQMDTRGLSASWLNTKTQRIGLGLTRDSLVVCFPTACTVQALADKMLALGCTSAINLDGGGSRSVFDGNFKELVKRTEDRANSTWLAIYLKKELEIEGHRVRVYSLKKDGSKYISKNFQLKEFACNDGTDVVFVSEELLDLLQKIRDHFNTSVTITSAYRTIAYNAKVDGSARESQHCNGMAADIKVKNHTPQEVVTFVESIMGDHGGIGKYSNFTHVDVRKTKARWNG